MTIKGNSLILAAMMLMGYIKGASIQSTLQSKAQWYKGEPDGKGGFKVESWNAKWTIGKMNVLIIDPYNKNYRLATKQGAKQLIFYDSQDANIVKTDYMDHFDILPGLVPNYIRPGTTDSYKTVTIRLSGTNWLLCYDVTTPAQENVWYSGGQHQGQGASLSGINTVKFAPNGEGYTPEQCSFGMNSQDDEGRDLFGYLTALKSYQDQLLYLNPLGFINDIISLLSYARISRNLAVLDTGDSNFNIYSGLTSADGVDVTQGLIRTDQGAGYFQNGSVPAQQTELDFLLKQTSQQCRTGNGFNWASAFQALIASSSGASEAELNAAKQEGFKAGNLTGYSLGVAAGQAAGFQPGFIEGQKQGNATGYQAGLNAGKAQGALEGYASGLAEGKSQGRQAGFDEGVLAGSAAGKVQGYNQGKADGYEAGRASCGLQPGTTVSVRNYTDDQGNNRKETTITAPDKTTIITEWDTYVPPPHVHHKIVEERWPDGRKNITYTQEADQWIWTNVTTVSVVPPRTETTVTNHTRNIIPQVDTKDHSVTTPTGTVKDSISIVDDPPRKTTTTDKDLPNGTHEHKVVVEDSSTGTTTTTTTNTYVDPEGHKHQDTNVDVQNSGRCPSALY